MTRSIRDGANAIHNLLFLVTYRLMAFPSSYPGNSSSPFVNVHALTSFLVCFNLKIAYHSVNCHYFLQGLIKLAVVFSIPAWGETPQIKLTTIIFSHVSLMEHNHYFLVGSPIPYSKWFVPSLPNTATSPPRKYSSRLAYLLRSSPILIGVCGYRSAVKLP